MHEYYEEVKNMNTGNVYYQPENFGLVIIDVLDEPDMSYEYNTLVIFQHVESGRIFYAMDSGCSCPTPFENFYFNGPDSTDMEELNSSTIESFERNVREFPVSEEERHNAISQVRNILMR